jgi:CheY-like chemotaxis protein
MANILYLEDEAWQVESTVIVFVERELGHTVTLTETISGAREQLSNRSFDVVFLDVMVDMAKGHIELENSGLKIAQEILDGEFAGAGNPPTMPIIIASGVWDATVKDAGGTGWTVEDRAHALGISQRHFLRKPFLADEVDSTLKEALKPGPQG